MATIPPTGTQWRITSGDWVAELVELGGGLRDLTNAGVPILVGYSEADPCQSGRGQHLMPWPNRIRDGRYSFAGADQQLALSEPDRRNASHGLTRFAAWHLLDQDAAAVTVGCRLLRQPGWPGVLDLSIRYALSSAGLTVTVTAQNVGASAVPFGYGAHPYISFAGSPMADVGLAVPADTYLQVDEDRLLPTGTAGVSATAFDFRTPQPLGDTSLDTAYTDLGRDADGRWRITVDRGAAGVVTVWGDAALPWVQLFNGKTKPLSDGITGIAVEPMSCPPDAFNSGTDLVVLQPGDAWQAEWGIDA